MFFVWFENPVWCENLYIYFFSNQLDIYVWPDLQPIALNLPVPISSFYGSKQHRVEDLGPRWQSGWHAMGKSSCSFGLSKYRQKIYWIFIPSMIGACMHAHMLLRMILTGIHFVCFPNWISSNNFDIILLQLNLPVPRLDHLACPSFEATNGPWSWACCTMIQVSLPCFWGTRLSWVDFKCDIHNIYASDILNLYVIYVFHLCGTHTNITFEMKKFPTLIFPWVVRCSRNFEIFFWMLHKSTPMQHK